MQGVRLRRSVNQDHPLYPRLTITVERNVWQLLCGRMRHVANYSLPSHLARENNGQQQVMTVYVKIGHMLGKMFFEFWMHTGSFTPFAPSWKVLKFGFRVKALILYSGNIVSMVTAYL